MLKRLVLLTLCLTLDYFATCDSNPTVLTKSGKVKGILHEHDKGAVYKFLKIPFAKPPIGDLRFRKPEPIDSWNDVIDATIQPPSCIQSLDLFKQFLSTLEMSEDCLFLSIYVPNELSSAKRKSVMVWIHGGGYALGQASMYDGSELAVTGDVIVVTVNYRLGVLGFLTTWDSAALGNYGLWDQIMALQWVHDNIESFGGNPDSVTIFGESAGGFSVGWLSLIPRNKGLFHRVIAQSGTASSPQSYNEKNKSYFKQTLEDVGCNKNEDDSNFVVECLRQVPAESFINTSMNSFWGGIMNDSIIPFGPRIDNELIFDEPDNILKDTASPSYQFMRSLDYMVGFTDADGAGVVMLAPSLTTDEQFNVTEGIPTKIICKTLFPIWAKSFYDGISETADALCKLYTVEDGDTTNKIEQAKNAIDSYGDMGFFAPAIASLNTHVKNNNLGKTYQYVFTYYRKSNVAFVQDYPDWVEGADHGTELPYLFNHKYFAEKANITIAEDDYKLADIMTSYWTNFAKTGNPNSDSLPKWPKYTEEKMEFMNLNLEPKQEMASDRFKERMRVWLHDIPNIVKRVKTSGHEEL